MSIGSPEVMKQLGVRMMIDRYRAVGHQFAKTDPLDINYHEKMPGKLNISSLRV